MKKFSKIIGAMFLGTAMVMCFAGCQANPNQKAITGKDAITSKVDGLASLPSEWKHSFKNTNGDLNVKIDAKLNVPNIEKLLETTVVANVMSVDKANSILQTLFPNSYCVDDNAQYDENMNIIKTKKEIEQFILENQKDINDLKSGMYREKPISSLEANRAIKELEEDIIKLRERYNTAPDEIIDNKLDSVTQKGIDDGTNFNVFSNDTSERLGLIGFSGGAYENGRAHMINIFNRKIVKDNPNHFEKDLTISKEDAEQEAKKFLEDNFDVNNLRLDYYLQMTNQRNMVDNNSKILDQINGHLFFFVKSYGGIPETFTNQGITGIESINADENPQYNFTWFGEYFQVLVTDFGVYEVDWKYPTKVIDGTEKEVALLPFDNIQQRFEEQSKLTQGWIDKSIGMKSREIVIDDIRLGVMKVKSKDKNEYKMVPVWDFFGYSTESFDKQPSGYYVLDANNQYVNKALCSYMTINAVDGTVIDRMLGY